MKDTFPMNRALAAMGLGTLAYALAQTTVLPALPALASALHTEQQNVTWMLTSYLIASAVFTPVFSRLGDLFGRHRMLVVVLAVFAAGSVISALSDHLGVVLAGRVLQGAGGGVIPLAVGIARSAFPAERRARAIGVISAIFGVGSGLGLVLGGLIVDHTSYTWIFWITAVMAAASAVAVGFGMPEAAGQSIGGRVDLIGTVLLGIGVTLPLLAVSRGSTWGWASGRTIGLIAVGLAVLVLFGLVERRVAHPLVDLRLLVLPSVLITNITTFLVGCGMFGVFVLVPQFAEAPTSTGYGFGADATRAGLLLLPGSLAMMAGGPVSAILYHRYGGRAALAAAAGVTALGSVLLAVGHGSQLAILCWSFVALVGVGVALAVIPTTVVHAVPAARAAEAAGVNALIRSVGSSIGTQVMAGILAGGLSAGSRLPSASAYSAAFLFCAAGALAAAVVAAFIPRVTVAARPATAGKTT
ncbi:MFS transporter [Micromonospora sp. NPDC050417]|uniref:MFS transporter n=1 Tax=Micromonospora sp. NPDC050417 TaxID=3364280 RepID=UPI0037B36BEE